MTRTHVSALALSIAIASTATLAHAAPLQIAPGVDILQSHCGKVDVPADLNPSWTHACGDGTKLFLKFQNGSPILAQTGRRDSASAQSVVGTVIGRSIDEVAPLASASSPDWMSVQMDLSRASTMGCGTFNPQQLMANKSQRCEDGSFIGFVPGNDAQGRHVAVLKRSTSADLSGPFMLGQAAGSRKPAAPNGVDPAHFVCYADQDPNYQACTAQSHLDANGRMVADRGAHFTRFTLDGSPVGTQMASNDGRRHMQHTPTQECERNYAPGYDLQQCYAKDYTGERVAGAVVVELAAGVAHRIAYGH